MKASLEPGRQPRLSRGQVDARHTDLGESQRARLVADARQQGLGLPTITLGTMHIAHPTILESRTWRWADEAACAAFAQQLSRQPGLAHAFITLQGPLGAGKTTLVRHLLRALGVAGRIKSPTYTVMEPYRAGELDIAHFDFYRFNDPREWEDAGFRDVFARPGLKLAEWPEKAAGTLPTPDLALHLDFDTAHAWGADDAPGTASADASPPARRLQAHALTLEGRQLLQALTEVA